LVALSAVALHNAAWRGVGFQRRRINADRLALDQARLGEPQDVGSIVSILKAVRRTRPAPAWNRISSCSEPRVGYVICEDAFQVVAEPFSDT
jgi:hypothetical protein